jgi:hypothetical protein
MADGTTETIRVCRRFPCERSPEGEHEVAVFVRDNHIRSIRTPCRGPVPDALRRLGAPTCHGVAEWIKEHLRTDKIGVLRGPSGNREEPDEFAATVNRILVKAHERRRRRRDVPWTREVDPLSSPTRTADYAFKSFIERQLDVNSWSSVFIGVSVQIGPRVISVIVAWWSGSRMEKLSRLYLTDADRFQAPTIDGRMIDNSVADEKVLPVLHRIPPSVIRAAIRIGGRHELRGELTSDLLRKLQAA